MVLTHNRDEDSKKQDIKLQDNVKHHILSLPKSLSAPMVGIVESVDALLTKKGHDQIVKHHEPKKSEEQNVIAQNRTLYAFADAHHHNAIGRIEGLLALEDLTRTNIID